MSGFTMAKKEGSSEDGLHPAELASILHGQLSKYEVLLQVKVSNPTPWLTVARRDSRDFPLASTDVHFRSPETIRVTAKPWRFVTVHRGIQQE